MIIRDFREDDLAVLEQHDPSPGRTRHHEAHSHRHAAEALAARRGDRHIGLGVADQNARAAALYLRLGYQETGCTYLDRYHPLDDDGTRHDVADPCRFLIKPLQPTAAPNHRVIGSSRPC